LLAEVLLVGVVEQLRLKQQLQQFVLLVEQPEQFVVLVVFVE
jgi:hypothetical protein